MTIQFLGARHGCNGRIYEHEFTMYIGAIRSSNERAHPQDWLVVLEHRHVAIEAYTRGLSHRVYGRLDRIEALCRPRAYCRRYYVDLARSARRRDKTILPLRSCPPSLEGRTRRRGAFAWHPIQRAGDPSWPTRVQYLTSRWARRSDTSRTLDGVYSASPSLRNTR